MTALQAVAPELAHPHTPVECVISTPTVDPGHSDRSHPLNIETYPYASSTSTQFVIPFCPPVAVTESFGFRVWNSRTEGSIACQYRKASHFNLENESEVGPMATTLMYVNLSLTSVLNTPPLLTAGHSVLDPFPSQKYPESHAVQTPDCSAYFPAGHTSSDVPAGQCTSGPHDTRLIGDAHTLPAGHFTGTALPCPHKSPRPQGNFVDGSGQYAPVGHRRGCTDPRGQYEPGSQAVFSVVFRQ